MPIRRRTSIGSTSSAYRSHPWNSIVPSTRAPAMRSFMRLKQRISVLLPHPDGPISAVISLPRMRMSMSRTAVAAP